MTGYSVTIVSASKDLSPKERVMAKDTTNALPIDQLTHEGPITISPAYYVELAVHNEKSDNTDYTKFVVVDEAGTKYVTGSSSFIAAYMDISNEMSGFDEPWQLEIYRKPSNNYKGKEFITCSIV